jgi:hypothetical protein
MLLSRLPNGAWCCGCARRVSPRLPNVVLRVLRGTADALCVASCEVSRRSLVRCCCGCCVCVYTRTGAHHILCLSRDACCEHSVLRTFPVANVPGCATRARGHESKLSWQDARNATVALRALRKTRACAAGWGVRKTCATPSSEQQQQ